MPDPDPLTLGPVPFPYLEEVIPALEPLQALCLFPGAPSLASWPAKSWGLKGKGPFGTKSQEELVWLVW